MKKIIILFLPLFFSLISLSQVSLTRVNNVPVPGDSNSYIKILFVDPGNAGPDQVWDFSGISLTGEKVLSKITSASSDKDKSSPDYDFVINEKDADYYIKVPSDSYQEVGGTKKGYILFYTDPVVRMIYPFAYGDHYTDNFTGLAKVKDVKRVDFNGVYSASADAYGTLILPDHAYLNVLRVKTESDGLEINPCNSVEVKMIHYLWYAPSHRYPLLNVSISERRVSGKDAGIEKSALVWSGGNGSNPEVTGQPQGIATVDDGSVVVVYPNPFSDI